LPTFPGLCNLCDLSFFIVIRFDAVIIRFYCFRNSNKNLCQFDTLRYESLYFTLFECRSLSCYVFIGFEGSLLFFWWTLTFRCIFSCTCFIEFCTWSIIICLIVINAIISFGFMICPQMNLMNFALILLFIALISNCFFFTE